MCYTAIIDRVKQDSSQIIGSMSVFQDVKRVFSCYTLELPWSNNDPFISCAPAGRYRVCKRHSEKYGNHWHLQDVKNRSLILIHWGNFHRDTLGCILVGSDVIDIDGDGHKDVTSSKSTMHALNGIIQDTYFELIINDNFE